MPDGVHTAYDSVLGRAKVSLATAVAVRQDVPVESLGRWYERSEGGLWTVDWAGAEGFDEQVTVPGGERVEFARPIRSWAIFAPGVRFGERYRKAERAREYLWFYFHLDGQLPPMSARPFTLIIDRDDLMADQVRAMAAAQGRGGPGDTLAAQGAFLAFLGYALSSAANDGGDHLRPWRLPEEGAPPSGLLADVDAQIMRSLSEPPSRAELAEALRMSESALAHRFRAETGMSIPDRVRWLRIREAKARLAEPGASVKTVAASLGFSSAFYFSRVFSEVVGLAPREYLERLARS